MGNVHQANAWMQLSTLFDAHKFASVELDSRIIFLIIFLIDILIGQVTLSLLTG